MAASVYIEGFRSPNIVFQAALSLPDKIVDSDSLLEVSTTAYIVPANVRLVCAMNAGPDDVTADFAETDGGSTVATYFIMARTTKYITVSEGNTLTFSSQAIPA